MIEMIISIAIMAILSTIVFGSFVTGNQRTLVRLAADQLMTDLRKQTSRAQSGEEYFNISRTAYGLVADITSPTAYTLFADNDLSGISTYGLPYQNVNGTGDDEPEKMVIRSLPAKTEIVGIYYTTSAATNLSTPAGSIYYPVPTGQAMVLSKVGNFINNPGGNNITALTIVVRHTRSTSVKECFKVVPLLQTITPLPYASCP